MEIKTLSLIERTILANQYKLFSLLDKKNEKEHLATAQIFEDGYTGLYEEALENMSDEVPKEICDETNDILSMYKRINKAIENLSKQDRKNIDLHKIRFDGFDADNDEHYYFAKFMIKKKHFYEHFSSAKLNSGSLASVPRYRKMLSVYKGIISKGNHSFGKKELRRLVEAVG